MLLVETAIFYLLLGGAVAVAVYIRGGTGNAVAVGLQMAAACLFWPLFVPMLLSESPVDTSERKESLESNPAQQDALAAAIFQVETELDAALEGLDGWAEDVLNSEQHRLKEPRMAWKAQADRIRQIDKLLAEPSARIDSLA